MLRLSHLRCIGRPMPLLRHITSTPSACKQIKPPRDAYEAHTHKMFMDDLIYNSGQRPLRPRVDEPIIAKKMFNGIVEEAQLMYPEVLTLEEFKSLEATKWEIDDYIHDRVQFTETGLTGDVHAEFQRRNMYGYNVPREFGGLGYRMSELAMLSEAEGQSVSVAMPLNAHRQACEIIDRFCTDEQRAKYLPRLAKGELVATVAFDEWNDEELKTVKTIADVDDDTDEWCLRGTKHSVVNSAAADLFVVLTKTRTLDRTGDPTDSLTALIVERSADGIIVHDRDNMIGCSNLYQSSVTFNNVTVPGADALVLLPGTGSFVGEQLSQLQRIQIAAMNLSKMRQITQLGADMLTMQETELRHRMGDMPYRTDTNTIRLQLAKNAVAVYSVESALYMTAGLIDIYEDTNVDMETAILKCHSQEQIMQMALGMSNCLDGRLGVSGSLASELLRDAIQLQTIGEPRDTLKMSIGIGGIQYSGQHIFDLVQKRRNPFEYPEDALQSFFRGESVNKFDSTLDLPGKVVPEYDIHANWLESSIARLRIGSSGLLMLYGKEVTGEHGEIQKLGDASIMNYVSLAALARGNRSWILKFKDAPYERLMAACLMQDNAARVKKLMEHIEQGPEETFETHYQSLTKIMVQSKSYNLVHPLFRFY